MNNYITSFNKKKLLKFLNIPNNRRQEFDDIFIESEAVIAGGFPLAIYTKTETELKKYKSSYKDIDIYVPVDKAQDLITKLRTFTTGLFVIRDITFVTMAPSYDQSFFRKNKIYGRTRFILNPNTAVDIIMVEKNHPVTRVVTNFDLTFCEIWYDGKDICATHQHHIINKIGKLRKEYRESLFKYANIFIMKRISKYTQRGFIINMGCSVDKCYTQKPTKSTDNPEEWVVKSIYKNIISGYIKNTDRVKAVSNHCLTEYTMKDLERVFKELTTSEFDFGIKRDLEYIKIETFTTHIFSKKDTNKKWLNYIKQYTGLSPDNIKSYKQYIDNNIFDKIIVDENTIPDTCIELTMADGSYNIQDHLTEEGTDALLFLIKDGNTFQVTCYSKQILQNSLNSDTDISYECSGKLFDNGDMSMKDPIMSKPYVKISTDLDGTNLYITEKDAKHIITRIKHIIYYLVPSKNKELISHTVTRSVLYADEEDQAMIGGNHCQAGSSILVYDVKECGGDNCIFSNRINPPLHTNYIDNVPRDNDQPPEPEYESEYEPEYEHDD